MGYFFLRRVASYLVLVVNVIAVDVFHFIRFGGGRRLLLCGIFFSDALRRIFLLLFMLLWSLLFLLLLFIFSYLGLEGGFYYGAFFSPTRCVASCSCCC